MFSRWGRKNPKQPPKEYVIADQGVSSALDLHMVVLAAAGYLPQSQGCGCIAVVAAGSLLHLNRVLGEERSKRSIGYL